MACCEVVFTMNWAKLRPAICGAYVVWKRGDEHPMNDVMPVMRWSFSMAWRTLSATSRVSCNPLPSGKNISTANWSRSAKGKRRIFSVGRMSSEAVMTARHAVMVPHGWRNVTAKTRS